MINRNVHNSVKEWNTWMQELLLKETVSSRNGVSWVVLCKSSKDVPPGGFSECRRAYYRLKWLQWHFTPLWIRHPGDKHSLEGLFTLSDREMQLSSALKRRKDKRARTKDDWRTWSFSLRIYLFLLISTFSKILPWCGWFSLWTQLSFHVPAKIWSCTHPITLLFQSSPLRWPWIP